MAEYNMGERPEITPPLLLWNEATGMVVIGFLSLKEAATAFKQAAAGKNVIAKHTDFGKIEVDDLLIEDNTHHTWTLHADGKTWIPA